MTQPLSGESSVLGTDLISDGFFWISTKEGAKSKEQRAGRDTEVVNRIGDRQAHQLRVARLVARRRMDLCERSCLARTTRTVRPVARIKLESVVGRAPYDGTPHRTAHSLI